MKTTDSRTTLILLKGYPATGKSFLAKNLSEKLNLPLIIRDKIKTRLIKKAYPLNTLGPKSYEVMWALAEELIKRGQSCICDTSLVQPYGLSVINKFSEKYDTRIVILECFCSDEKVQMERLEKRKKYPSYYSINTRTDLETFKQKNQSYRDYEFPYQTIKIDTSKPYDLEDIVKKMNVRTEKVIG